MSNHFKEIVGINISGTNDWRYMELYFERAHNPPAADPEVEALRLRYGRLVEKLHQVSKSQDQFFPIFNRAIDGARSALVAEGGRVSDGIERIEGLEREVLWLARRRRQQYFLHILFIGAIVSLFGFAIAWLMARFGAVEQVNLSWIIPAALALPGASLGVVFVGFATNRFFGYDNVGHLDQYDFVPWERFLWVTIISFILLAALWFKALAFGFGETVLLQNVDQRPEYGFFIGLICGVSEAAVAELIFRVMKPPTPR